MVRRVWIVAVLALTLKTFIAGAPAAAMPASPVGMVEASPSLAGGVQYDGGRAYRTRRAYRRVPAYRSRDDRPLRAYRSQTVCRVRYTPYGARRVCFRR